MARSRRAPRRRRSARARPQRRPALRPGASAAPHHVIPTIRLVAGKLPEIAEEIAHALIAGGAPVFARGGTLVEPVCETMTAADGRKTITARLRPLSIEFLAVAGRRCRNLPELQPQT